MWDRLGTRLEAELSGGSFSRAETSRALALRGPALVPPTRGRLPRLPTAGMAASFLDAWEGSSARKCPAGVERLTPLRAKTPRLRGRDGGRAGGQGQVPRGRALSA